MTGWIYRPETDGALLAMEAAVHHAPMLRERSGDYGEFARLPPAAIFCSSAIRSRCPTLSIALPA